MRSVQVRVGYRPPDLYTPCFPAAQQRATHCRTTYAGAWSIAQDDYGRQQAPRCNSCVQAVDAIIAGVQASK